MNRSERCILFDWGDTLMRVFPEYDGPMMSWPEVAAVPHAAEALEALRSNWLLAVATNAGESEEAEIRAALRRASLDHFFDRIYCFRKIGHKKPSPEFFNDILNDLGLAARQVVMVGDDFVGDVLGANACGIRAVWYNGRGSEIRDGAAYRTIHDLLSLPATLAAMG